MTSALTRDPAAAAPVGYRPQREKSRTDRTMQALARSPIGGWLFINVFPGIDRWLIPLSRGRLKVAIGQPILLLHTRGARSGQPRTSPLLYTPRGDALVIVASKAGNTHHPAWYHNLRAHPGSVTVEVNGTRSVVHPRVAEGSEREALWQLVNDNYNGYDAYQARAGERIIPIVILEPKARVSVTGRGSRSAHRRWPALGAREEDRIPAADRAAVEKR